MCPTYAYSCKKCDKHFDRMNTISKRNESVCPECGNTDNDRHIGAGSGFILAGDGFYEQIKKDAEFQQPITKKKER